MSVRRWGRLPAIGIYTSQTEHDDSKADASDEPQIPAEFAASKADDRSGDDADAITFSQCF